MYPFGTAISSPLPPTQERPLRARWAQREAAGYCRARR